MVKMFWKELIDIVREKRKRKPKPEEEEIYERDGMKFYYNDDVDKWIIDIIIDGFNYTEPIKTVVDVGAHIGSFSIVAASKGKAQNVYAIEPDFNNFYLLKKNIKLNKFGKIIHPINVALSDKNGLEPLHYLKGLNSGQRSLVYNTDVFTKIDYVPTITFKTLMSIIEDTPDCLKMDIEAAEFKVLMKEENIDLLKRFTFIDIDIHSPANTDYFDENTVSGLIEQGVIESTESACGDLIQFIKDCGFEVIASKSTSREYADGNYVFSRF